MRVLLESDSKGLCCRVTLGSVWSVFEAFVLRACCMSVVIDFVPVGVLRSALMRCGKVCRRVVFWGLSW